MSEGTVEPDKQHTNRLIAETSPYLLQHAHNPVDWYPWGEEALERSKSEDKPILLSIGYSACHWCHVMERESFEDQAIARLMNKHFVCIKVDREERPDLDEIYMAATLAINHGQGGWPMTVFLTPDQKPFFAGTYFPPKDGYGRPGFSKLLTQLSEAFRTEREQITQSSVRLTDLLREESAAVRKRLIGQDTLESAIEQLSRGFDERYGGFGPAPKFPPSMAVSLLLRYHDRTGHERALAMARKTLDAMAHGGMYDQVGSGFARYSTDERWLVPHFEKMLYDNALLAKVYLEAFQLTKAPLYERIGREVLDYVLLEMTSAEGAFYSATDADSEGVEGKFFVWTPDEIHRILDKETAEYFCDYYDIEKGGNWEGKSIPNIHGSIERVAQHHRIDPEHFRALLDEGKKKVYEARKERVAPALDDKILTAWNALMISAMAFGCRVLGDSRYGEAAEHAVDFIRKRLTNVNGQLLRTYRSDKAHLQAYLEDHAYLSNALIDLYETTGRQSDLDWALALAERLLSDFRDEESGAFFSTAKDHEPLIVRKKDGQDGAIPSANAVAAHALARLSFLLDHEDFRRAAEQAASAYGQLIERAPRAFCKTLAVMDFLLEGPTELALVGTAGDAGFEALRRSVNEIYLPNQVFATRTPEDGNKPVVPLLEEKYLVSGKPALYICRNFSCQAPVTDPKKVREALSRYREDTARHRKTVLSNP